MGSLAGYALLLSPLIYGSIYIYIERHFTDNVMVQRFLKTATVLCGVLLIVFGCTDTVSFDVPMPSRGTARHTVPGSLFLVILGVFQMTLPLYSKYIRFTNPDE